MRILIISLSLLILSLPLMAEVRSDSEGQEKDRSAVLDLAQRAFDAVESNDPADWRPLLTEKAHTLSFRPNGLMRERSYADSMDRMIPGESDYFEQWIGEPTVMVHGPLAVVWGRYAFWNRGNLSHCGIDTISMAKVQGVWKIAHFMWTVEPDTCPSTTPKQRPISDRD